MKEIKTLYDAVEFFIPSFEKVEYLFKKDEDSFAAFCHSQLSGGIGMQIRNYLELWNENSVMHIYMKTVYNCENPEEMSDKILREIYKMVTSKNKL